MKQRERRFHTLALLTIALAACSGGQTGQGTTPGSGFDQLPRTRFNQLAVRLNLPLFWEADRNGNGAVDPDEVRTLLFYPSSEAWVEGGAFTPAFERAYTELMRAAAEPQPQDERQRLVRLELDNTLPTLVHTDLGSLPEDHQAFARRMLRAGELIDQLYARQIGMTALAAQASAVDRESQSLFRRNWGVGCRGASTESEEACSALPGVQGQAVDVYPASLQSANDFCQALEARPNAKQLLTPFTVVREAAGELTAVPYTEAYAEQMGPIAAELRAAAEELTDPAEEALRAYLRAAAQAFTDNNWEPADEAWAAMNGRNSRWYLRVGPDETYWEPCSQKAGFHLTLALINRDSLAWQDRLTPLRSDMEAALAGLTDAYSAREVAFSLPDFIDIVANFGDDRSPFGATIGQSLPNWGPVSDDGRGRTVAMSNLYTDPDSAAQRRDRASTMISAETMALYTEAPEPGLLSTILHEACHNLGPSHDFRVNGQTDAEAFGGGLASMLEELKAQSGALYLLDLLRQRGVITAEQQRQSYLDSIVWALGHISRGMYTASGGRKAYSQLAAIQVGFLMDEGAIRWDPEGLAANGTDRGAFTIDFEAFPTAVERLMTLVMEIKARGDRARAEELAARYVDGDVVPQAVVAERSRRFAQSTFVYSIDL